MTVKEFFGEAWHVDADKVEFIFTDDNNEEYVFTMETINYFSKGEMFFKNDVGYSAYIATAEFYHEVFDNANIVRWGLSDYSGERRMYIVIDFSYKDYIDYI